MMGFEASTSANAIQRLTDGIQGLPTTLDSVVSVTQRIASMTGDLELATETTLALNNAVIVSGGSAAAASRATEQYMQMLSAGKVDMQSWRTLQETMAYALKETASSFGYAGESAQNDLYAALKEGDITFNEFNARLIEINNSTGGFAETALAASGGIATATTNANTAVARGMTSIIAAVDKGATKWGGIEGVITKFGKAGESALKNVSKYAGPVVKNLDKIAVGAATAGAVFVAWKVGSVLTNINKQFHITSAALMTFSAVQKTVSLEQAALNGTMTIGQIATAAYTGQIGIMTAAKGVAKVATDKLNAAIAANPFGAAAVAITAVVGSLALVAKAAYDSMSEFHELTDAARDSSKAIAEINDAFNDSVSDAEGTTYAASRLVDELTRLEAKMSDLEAQNADTTTEQHRYANVASELQELMPDLNVEIDEQTGLIKGNTSALYDNIEALKLQYLEAAFAERNTKILKEQGKVWADLLDAQAQLEPVTNRLNEIYSELGKTFGLTAEELHELAMGNSLVWQEMIAATDASEELQSGMYDLFNEIYTLSVESDSLTSAIRANENAMADQNAQIAENNLGWTYYQEQLVATESATSSLGTVTIRSAEAIAAAMQDVEGIQKEALDGVMSAFSAMSSGLTDLTSKIVEDNTLTWSKIQENQANAIAKTEEFSLLYAQLITAGVSESYLNAIGATGPEAIPLLEGMLKDGADAVLASQSEWEAAYGSVTNTLADSLALDPETNAAIQEYISGETGIMGSLRGAVEDADFASLGIVTMERYAEGIEDGVASASETVANAINSLWDTNGGDISADEATGFYAQGVSAMEGYGTGVTDSAPAAAGAVTAAAEGIIAAMATAQDSHSPSVVFAELGKDAIDGYIQGIDENVELAAQSITSLITAASDAAKEQIVLLDFNSIGLMIAQGIADGITDGQSSIVASMVEAIDAAKVTAQEAADTHSPSRWFKNEIGRNIILGMAEGIDDNVGEAVRAMTGAMEAVKDITVFRPSNVPIVASASNPTTSTGGAPTIIQHIEARDMTAWELEVAAQAIFERSRW